MVEIKTPIEAVYLSAAARFIERFEAVHDLAQATMNQAGTLVKMHMTAHAMRSAARLWERRVPQVGCLSRKISLNSRGLDIDEVRLCATRFSFSDWENELGELGVSLMRFRLRVTATGFEFFDEMLAYFSRHALARRFERGYGTTPAAVTDDLRLLIEAGAKIDKGAKSVRIEVPGGTWIGIPTRSEHAITGEQDFVAFRTFHAPGEKGES